MPQGAERGCPRTGVTGRCELPGVYSGNGTCKQVRLTTELSKDGSIP